jgi:membrane-associated phospholipid phosphatase
MTLGHAAKTRSFPDRARITAPQSGSWWLPAGLRRRIRRSSHGTAQTAGGSALRTSALAAWCMTAAATFLTIVATPLLGFSFNGRSLIQLSALTLGLIALHVVYTRLRPDPPTGPIWGGIAILVWSTAMAGSLSLMGLSLGAPLIDATLAGLDAAIGVNALRITVWIADFPAAVGLLYFAYEASSFLLLISVIHLSLTGRRDRLWELCLIFSGSLTFCVLSSAFLPAIGAFAYYQIAPDVIERLPPEAGTYHLACFDAYRSGRLTWVDVRQLCGAVTFPSFHTCMALIAAYAYRNSPLAIPAGVWTGIVMISTIPIGGHYVVDLLAGAGVFAAFAFFASRCRRLEHWPSRAPSRQPVKAGR